MLKLKSLIAILLAAVLLLGAAGCGETKKNDPTESTPQSDKREPYKEEEVFLTKDFVDTDGEFEFDTVDFKGPEGYVIVVPAGDSEAKKQAEKIKKYYSDASLKIVTDKTAETEKEILVGNTNRSESKNSLKENELKSALVGEKLVFTAGHYVTLGVAVDKYIRTAPKKGKASVFELATDFTATVPGGYTYVWGDEFEGSDVDFTKWSFGKHMSGTTKMEISYDKNVIDVNDGRLKLHGLRYYNPKRSETEFRVPYSVATQNKMHYLYGYVEIRCKLPFFQGVWPSFWAKSSDPNIKVEGDPNSFMAELDIFEVFGKKLVQPGIIKWYGDGKSSISADHMNINYWSWENNEKIETEYHTYGCEWTPEHFAVSVDGEVYYTFDITKTYDGRENMSSFHEPIYLIFNNHLFPEDSHMSVPRIEDNADLLPSCYYIDYIRLYQKDGVGSLYTDYTDDSALYADRK